MARVGGVDLPRNKRMEVAVTYIYGIGPTLGKLVLKQANVDPDTRTGNLTDQEINRLNKILHEYKIEGDLRRSVAMNIKNLMNLGSYRGLRHRRGLPVRGQRTRTNSRTRKGKRKTVGGKSKG
ncbi:MAG TPA: 30S ribosomal protein S13 [Deltaproteobacteria bacterium]|nr:MAG: 30S ribosomal protein S13 [bacterium]HDH10449.1 30S ribosomal protein S13 [Deltaproteobacteria bacterium]